MSRYYIDFYNLMGMLTLEQIVKDYEKITKGNIDIILEPKRQKVEESGQVQTAIKSLVDAQPHGSLEDVVERLKHYKCIIFINYSSFMHGIGLTPDKYGYGFNNNAAIILFMLPEPSTSSPPVRTDDISYMLLHPLNSIMSKDAVRLHLQKPYFQWHHDLGRLFLQITQNTKNRFTRAAHTVGFLHALLPMNIPFFFVNYGGGDLELLNRMFGEERSVFYTNPLHTLKDITDEKAFGFYLNDLSNLGSYMFDECMEVKLPSVVPKFEEFVATHHMKISKEELFGKTLVDIQFYD
ncbi:hypothetical protein SNEBB_009162 [Seison nebaliae]|nr:hypothetical protein SNEBB_009162 [Seison nebaliae]